MACTSKNAVSVQTLNLVTQLERHLCFVEDIAQASSVEVLRIVTAQVIAQLGYQSFWLTGTGEEALASISELNFHNVSNKVLAECAEVEQFGDESPWVLSSSISKPFHWVTREYMKNAKSEKAKMVCDIAARHRCNAGLKVPVNDPKTGLFVQLDFSTPECRVYVNELSTLALVSQVVINRLFWFLWDEGSVELTKDHELALSLEHDPRVLHVLVARLGISHTDAATLLQDAERKREFLCMSEAIHKHGQAHVFPSRVALSVK